jgi:hypothetical protein
VGDEARAIDPALELLVSSVDKLPERHDGGPAITLTVHGLIISGVMIASWQWFQDAEQLCRDADGGAVWAEISKVFSEGLRTVRSESQVVHEVIEDFAQRYRDALLKVDRPMYIHLRDARSWPGGSTSPIPTVGTYWRGRLSDVSGWWFGLLAEGPNNK